VPLQEIATARQTVLSRGFAIYFFGCRNVNHCSDDYDFDFVCNNGLIMACQSLLYNGARRSFLQESGSAE
jgi:hypothetical protein